MSASLLESFFIMFESNSDDVKKGSKEAGEAVDNLEDQIDQADKKTKKLGDGFTSMIKGAAGAFAALMSISTITTGIFNASAQADQLHDLSRALGVNASELDAWGGVAKSTGGSFEGLIGSLQSMKQNIMSLDATGRSVVQPYFNRMGIATRDATGKMRPMLELLPELAKAFQGMSQERSMDFGKKLGLDIQTIMLLQKGQREVNSLINKQKELGTVTLEDAEAADKYYASMDDLSQVFKVFFSQVAGDILPALTWLNEVFISIGKWMQQHKGFIYGFLGGLALVIGVVAIKTGALAIAFNLLVAPITLVMGVALALGAVIGLLVDDWKKFSEGGESALKPIWEGLQWVGDKIQWLMDKYEKFKSSLKGVVGGWIINSLGNNPDELIQDARIQMDRAGSNPINSQTSTSITAANSSTSRNNNITIDQITIETQATDAQGISNGISQGLTREVNSASANFDDGIMG